MLEDLNSFISFKVSGTNGGKTTEATVTFGDGSKLIGMEVTICDEKYNKYTAELVPDTGSPGDTLSAHFIDMQRKIANTGFRVFLFGTPRDAGNQ